MNHCLSALSREIAEEAERQSERLTGLVQIKAHLSEKEPQPRSKKKQLRKRKVNGNFHSSGATVSCRQLKSEIPAARQKKKIDPAWKKS